MDSELMPTRCQPNIVNEVSDQLRVEFPCDPALRSVGRVAVIGVLLRLRMPMVAVEEFRSELDAAIGLAAGVDPDPRAVLKVNARWDEAEIAVEISGPASEQMLGRPRAFR
jgi:hypothetical protein